MSYSQRSKSNVTTLEPLLAFTMGQIRMKLHQFLIISFRDFVQTDTETDKQMPPKY